VKDSFIIVPFGNYYVRVDGKININLSWVQSEKMKLTQTSNKQH